MRALRNLYLCTETIHAGALHVMSIPIFPISITSMLGQLVVRMSRKPTCCILSRLPVNRRGYNGQQKALFVTLVDNVPQFEAYTEASFSPNSIDSLCLRVAQVPSSREVAIFVLTTIPRRQLAHPPINNVIHMHYV
jgi:hypothetical protein